MIDVTISADVSVFLQIEQIIFIILDGFFLLQTELL